MPNLLDGNYHSQMYSESFIEPYSITTHEIPIDKNSQDAASFILRTGMDQPTSPDVPEYDYSLTKQVHQDEISLFCNVSNSIEEADIEEEMNVTDCGVTS